MSTWNQCDGPNKIIESKIAGLKNGKNQAQTQVFFRKDEFHNSEHVWLSMLKLWV
jgi:hypothetical protein